jgi:hypothetical protein
MSLTVAPNGRVASHARVSLKRCISGVRPVCLGWERSRGIHAREVVSVISGRRSRSGPHAWPEMGR